MKSKFDPNAEREIPTVAPERGFGDDRQFDSVQLIITTHCDRMCPGCICNIPYLKKHQHVDADWIKQIAPKLQGLRLLQISGGEPTLHPEFQYITEHLREWFNPQVLMLVTNGRNVTKYADILGHYDHISISRFTKGSYPGSRHNAFTIERFKRVFEGPSKIHEDVTRHKLNRENKNKWPCIIGANDIALIQWNKMHPCCAAAGRAPKMGIEITENWREELKEVKLPCEGCPFAVSEKIHKFLSQWLVEQTPERYEKWKRYKKIQDIKEANVHKSIMRKGYSKWKRQWREKLKKIDEDIY